MTQPASKANRTSGWRLTRLALAWLAGSALHLQQSALLPTAFCVAAMALGLIGLGAGWRWRRAHVVALVGIAALAWGAAGWRAAERWADALPAGLEGQEVSVVGLVSSLPQRSPSGLRFRFDVETAQRGGEPVQLPAHLLLGWYKGFHDDAASVQPRSEVRAGQRWHFALKLRRPHGNVNPYGFDYELYLFEQGVRATGYVRDAPAPQLLQRDAAFPLERLRQRVRDGIEASIPDPRMAGVIAALAVGDQGAIVVAVTKPASTLPREKPFRAERV